MLLMIYAILGVAFYYLPAHRAAKLEPARLPQPATSSLPAFDPGLTRTPRA
jgi:hypothetical protein